MTRSSQCWVGFVTCLVIWLVGVAPVAAHEGLSAAVPAPGDTVGGEVEVLQLWFGEPLADVSVRVIDPAGNQINGAIDQPLEGLVEVQVPKIENEGTYVVAYDIQYVDEAVFNAVYQFTYDRDGLPPIPLVPGSTEASPVVGVAKWVLVGSTVVLALLLGWRFRQSQLARLDQAEDSGL